jgi:hypothetical protein
VASSAVAGIQTGNSMGAPRPARPSIQQAATWLGTQPEDNSPVHRHGRIKAIRIGPRLIRIERESLLAFAARVGNY